MCIRDSGIPVSGTHAHSWVMAFPSELEAFRAFAKSSPKNCVLLIDTYDAVSYTHLDVYKRQLFTQTSMAHGCRGPVEEVVTFGVRKGPGARGAPGPMRSPL